MVYRHRETGVSVTLIHPTIDALCAAPAAARSHRCCTPSARSSGPRGRHQEGCPRQAVYLPYERETNRRTAARQGKGVGEDRRWTDVHTNRRNLGIGGPTMEIRHGETGRVHVVVAKDSLRGCDLRRARLRGADLSEADLSGARLSSADLTGADLTGANLQGANLAGLPPRVSWLHAVDAALLVVGIGMIVWVVLYRGSLFHATLAVVGAALVRWLSTPAAHLADASLQNACLIGAGLSGCDLQGANLTAAVYDGATRWPVGLHPVWEGAVRVVE